jgi:hypothetical protein
MRFHNRVLRPVKLQKQKYVLASIRCENLTFPMKFLCEDRSAELTVYIGYGYIPGCFKYDLEMTS